MKEKGRLRTKKRYEKSDMAVTFGMSKGLSAGGYKGLNKGIKRPYGLVHRQMAEEKD